MQASGDDLEPKLVPKITARSTCNIPMCRSCLIGKDKQTPSKSILKTSNPNKTNVIKAKDLLPGYCVSIYQFE